MVRAFLLILAALGAVPATAAAEGDFLVIHADQTQAQREATFSSFRQPLICARVWHP